MRLPELTTDGFPLVVIGRSDVGSKVDIDNEGAARTLTDHLLSVGRTRIAHLPYAPLAHHSSRMRLLGWRGAMVRAGRASDDAWVAPADFAAGSGRRAMEAILRRVRPDAVFAGNDVVAFGAMTALRAAGLRIPQDVAVVGFDDVPLAAHAAPPLTTMRLPAVDMGRAAAERLIGFIEAAAEAPSAADPQGDGTWSTELVVRESCGA